jgi:hypothetical protein
MAKAKKKKKQGNQTKVMNPMALSLLARLKAAKMSGWRMLRQDDYQQGYDKARRYWAHSDNQLYELEQIYNFVLSERPIIYTAISWRALKDEIASRMPQRSELHELTGYDL